MLGLCMSAWATQPQLVSLNPSSGGGASQTFALSVSDTAGTADIGPINLLINSSLNGYTGCWIYFNHPGQFSLYSNGQWAGPASTGSSLSSSACSVQLVSGSDSGNYVNVSFAITFDPSFNGSKTIWAAAGDVDGDNTGYQPMGTYNVSTSGGVPSNVSVSPNNPTMYQGSPQTFTVVASDSAGATDLQGIHFLFARGGYNETPAEPTACWMWYQRSTNTLTMYDQGTWSAPTPLGSGGAVLTGDECTVDTTQASASGSGNQLTLVVTVVPTTDIGDGIYMNALTNANSATDYQQMGLATIYPPANNQGSFTVSDGSGSETQPHGISPTQNGGAYVIVTASGGFSGPVTLSGNSQGARSGNTAQLSFSFDPQPVETQGHSIATISMGSAVPDRYSVSVTGTSQGQSATSGQLTFYVDSAPPAVTMSAPMRTQSGVTFNIDATDAAGFGAIQYMELLIAPSVNGANACWVAWSVWPASSLALATDNGDGWAFAGNTQLPSGPNGTSPAASNSQCTVSGNASKVDYNTGTPDTNMSPNEERWTIPITFQPGFTGTQTVYVNATNYAGLSTGYQPLGTVTTP
ncbi:MAG TPA: hypothetical protein VHC90_12815 [Bryobacteraceae bacterium]|nr:hypothetical protein [Bryobacteraceae bacterium]